MMDYIRNLKLQPNYDPNTRHCFYGADADLIMLSLLTHEPHFMIIREEHVKNKDKQTTGVSRADVRSPPNLQMIYISVLREYFLLEYREFAPKMKLRFDIERIIDDFIFFCFFIGNDFLPSLSALDIAEGSLDHLISNYKSCLPEMTDYITNQGTIHWDRAEPFIALLGSHEHEVFTNRVESLNENHKRYNQRQKGKNGKKPEKDVNELQQKKMQKCAQYFIDNTQKEHKKACLIKKFAKQNPEEVDQELLQKYTGIRDFQQQQEKKEKVLNENETLNSIIKDIDSAYLSDLNAGDISSSELSDQEELKEHKEEQIEESKPKEPETEQELEDRYIEENRRFMSAFVTEYKQDAKAAKGNYYHQKLKFNMTDKKG